MKIIEPSFEILFPTPEIAREWSLRLTEIAGRTCYKSEDRITDDSAPAFAQMLIDRTHEAMIEIGIDPVVRFVCDRGVSHEIVRHRLASYGQESTRYCNYSKDKHGGGISLTPMLDGLSVKQIQRRNELYLHIEEVYLTEVSEGVKPQQARDNLPTCLKTEIVMKANVREWRHFFKLRTAKVAHPQLRKVTRPLLAAFRELIPVVFDDVGVV